MPNNKNINDWLSANMGENIKDLISVPKSTSPQDGMEDTSAPVGNLNRGDLSRAIAESIKKYEDENKGKV